MIKLKTKYKDCENGEANFGVVKYDCKHSNTIEHIALIVFLMEQIREQEKEYGTTDKDIFNMIKELKKMLEKGDNKDGKRSSENK